VAGEDSPQKRAVRETLSLQNQKLKQIQELKSVVQKEIDSLNSAVLKSEFQKVKMHEKEAHHQMQMSKIKSQD